MSRLLWFVSAPRSEPGTNVGALPESSPRGEGTAAQQLNESLLSECLASAHRSGHSPLCNTLSCLLFISFIRTDVWSFCLFVFLFCFWHFFSCNGKGRVFAGKGERRNDCTFFINHTSSSDTKHRFPHRAGNSPPHPRVSHWHFGSLAPHLHSSLQDPPPCTANIHPQTHFLRECFLTPLTVLLNNHT